MHSAGRPGAPVEALECDTSSVDPGVRMLPWWDFEFISTKKEKDQLVTAVSA